MRRVLAVVLFVTSIVVLVAAFVPGADAATFVDAGWWDRNNGAPLGGAGPPPDGAIRVQQDVNGPSAVAAVRYLIGADEVNPVLELRVTGSPVSGNAGFLACRPTESWAGADGGPWAERPVPDCDAGRAGGTASADGTLVRFDLRNLVDDGLVDVVISPAPTANDPIQNSFTTDFAGPADDDLSTTRQTTTTTTTSAPPATSPPTTSPQFSTPPTTRSFVPPPPTTSTTRASTVTSAPVAATSTTVVATTVPSDLAVGPTSGDSDSGNRRPFAVVIALAIAGLGAYLWNAERSNPTVPEGEIIGGLGAFRRPRTEGAPEVS